MPPPASAWFSLATSAPRGKKTSVLDPATRRHSVGLQSRSTQFAHATRHGADRVAPIHRPAGSRRTSRLASAARQSLGRFPGQLGLCGRAGRDRGSAVGDRQAGNDGSLSGSRPAFARRALGGAARTTGEHLPGHEQPRGRGFGGRTARLSAAAVCASPTPAAAAMTRPIATVLT